ncbi:hypothetical protein HY792_07270 [Candidatus Desantisbacteria bacterium]|nr:hypothetical protein [Candidatus Desantisbacteria bacterium]
MRKSLRNKGQGLEPGGSRGINKTVEIVAINRTRIEKRIQEQEEDKKNRLYEEELMEIKARIIATSLNLSDESFQLGEILTLIVPKKICPWQS